MRKANGARKKPGRAPAPKVPKPPKRKRKRALPKQVRTPKPPTPTPTPTPTATPAPPPEWFANWLKDLDYRYPDEAGLFDPPRPAATWTPGPTLQPHPWETPGGPWPTLMPRPTRTPWPTYPPVPERPWPTETHEPVWPEPGSALPTVAPPGWKYKLGKAFAVAMTYGPIVAAAAYPPIAVADLLAFAALVYGGVRASQDPPPTPQVNWLPQPTPRPSYGEYEAQWAWPQQRQTLAQREAAEWKRFREAYDAWKALEPTYEGTKEEREAELQKLMEELQAELEGLKYRKPGEPGEPGPWIPPEP